MTSTATFTPDWISAPGETIADLLEERGWTQTELAKRTGFTKKHINLLIKGNAPIYEDTALKLERVLGSTARFWLAREAQYRETLARAKERKSLGQDSAWLKQIPLKDMIRFGWVRELKDKGEQVAECLRFFGVASVPVWESQANQPLAAFRMSPTYKERLKKESNFPIAAWLRQGERRATEIACRPFDKDRFREKLVELRALTNEADPKIFIPKLTTICAEAGVVAVLEPAPKGCPISGATRWLPSGKALLMLSARHKTDDHLWFTFFHEAGHLLLHDKRLAFIEIQGGLDDELEEQANVFARDLLIPPNFASQLAALPNTKIGVSTFAQKIGIAPGIVVGRMQKEKLLDWSYLNGLKISYRWDHEK